VRKVSIPWRSTLNHMRDSRLLAAGWVAAAIAAEKPSVIQWRLVVDQELRISAPQAGPNLLTN